MATVTVYEFTEYDVRTDSTTLNPFMATEALARKRGKLLPETSKEVDAAEIDMAGYYRPKARGDA